MNPNKNASSSHPNYSSPDPANKPMLDISTNKKEKPLEPVLPLQYTQTDSIKIAIVGDPGVGARSLHLRLTDGKFVPNARKFDFRLPTEYMCHDMLVDNKKYNVVVYDSCTRKEFNPALDDKKEHFFANICFTEANAILLCFSVEKPSSFKSLVHWLELVNENAKPNTPIYIVCLKSDLQPSRYITNVRNTSVDLEDAHKFADERNLRFFTVSALTGEGTHELFDMVIHDIEGGRMGKRDQPRQINAKRNETDSPTGREIADAIARTIKFESNVDSVNHAMYFSQQNRMAVIPDPVMSPNLMGFSTPIRGIWSSGKVGKSDSAFAERLRQTFSNSPHTGIKAKITKDMSESSRHKGDEDVPFS